MNRFILLVMVLPWLTGCPERLDQAIYPQPSSQSTHIGLIVSQPSQIPAQSSAREYAAMLAVEEINATGGVNGRPLDLVLRYDQDQPENAVIAARQLLAQDVVAIIGPITSRSTLAVAQQVTIAAGMPVISHGATSPLLTNLDDHNTVYRIPPSDILQGRVLAERIWAEGHRKLAIAYLDDAYGAGLYHVIKQYLEAQGGEVVASSQLSTQEGQISDGQVAELFAGKATPDALVIVALPLSSANLIRQVYLQKGALPALYGVDANMGTGSGFLDNAIPQTAGMRGTNTIPDSSGLSYHLFADAYQRRLGQDFASGFDAATYDAVYLVALAMAEAGANNQQAVLNHLMTVSRPDSSTPVLAFATQFSQAIEAIRLGKDIDYQGVTGAINFDSQGDPTAGVFSYQQVTTDNTGHLQFQNLATIHYPAED